MIRDRVLQDELDRDTQQGLWEPLKSIDDVEYRPTNDMLHDDDLLADYYKFCRENENE